MTGLRFARPLARRTGALGRREGWDLEHIVVLALGANRLARAISVDEITEPVRSATADWAGRRLPAGAAQRLKDLVECPVCVGWWTSLAVSLWAPGERRLQRGVAIAGAQVLLTLAERLVSERGRAAIHEAEIAEITETVMADGEEPSNSAPATTSEADARVE
jgi:hypothetical protein